MRLFNILLTSLLLLCIALLPSNTVVAIEDELIEIIEQLPVPPLYHDRYNPLIALMERVFGVPVNPPSSASTTTTRDDMYESYVASQLQHWHCKRLCYEQQHKNRLDVNSVQIHLLPEPNNSNTSVYHIELIFPVALKITDIHVSMLGSLLTINATYIKVYTTEEAYALDKCHCPIVEALPPLHLGHVMSDEKGAVRAVQRFTRSYHLQRPDVEAADVKMWWTDDMSATYLHIAVPQAPLQYVELPVKHLNVTDMTAFVAPEMHREGELHENDLRSDL